MKAFETQIVRTGAKSQPVNSLLLVELEVRRGKAGVREKNQVRDDRSRHWKCRPCCHSLISTAALGSQREILGEP